MKIDKHLFRTAMLMGVSGSLDKEECTASARIIDGDPGFQEILSACKEEMIDKSPRNFHCIVGSVFQQAFDVGVEYQKLVQELEHVPEPSKPEKADTASV